jgi:hypothetical protein
MSTLVEWRVEAPATATAKDRWDGRSEGREKAKAMLLERRKGSWVGGSVVIGVQRRLTLRFEFDLSLVRGHSNDSVPSWVSHHNSF